MKSNTVFKLNCNENPLGASPHAIRAVQAAIHEMHVYPETETPLKTLLSEQHNIHPDQITLGNGSENVLELLLKAYLKPNESAIISQYTFMTIPFLIQTAGAQIITVPALDFGHDLNQMLIAIQKNTRFIFIVNPNNPTGTYLNHTALENFLSHVPGHILVVLDEAYIDYAEVCDFPNSIALLKKFPNLIIVRTFSKAYGLAGLRLGYSITSLDIASVLKQFHLPFHVNRFALIAGCEAVKDHAHLLATKEINNEGKQHLYQALKTLTLNYIPSFCNFVTVNVKNACHISKRMREANVWVRPLTDYHLENHLRISIGNQAAMLACIQALKHALIINNEDTHDGH